MKRNISNKALRKRRSRAKIFGTAEKPRLSVFRSNRHTYVQLIDDEKGNTMISARVQAGISKAKELGATIARKAREAGIEQAVLHRGPYKYHGRVKAVAEGAREGGLKI